MRPAGLRLQLDRRRRRHWRGVAINPELWITPDPIGEADEDDESEGCLSIPGERFPLRRAEHAMLRAVDLDQKPFEIEADGWLARIFQHEYDHLDGVLYADRLEHRTRGRSAKVDQEAGLGIARPHLAAGRGPPRGLGSRSER